MAPYARYHEVRPTVEEKIKAKTTTDPVDFALAKYYRAKKQTEAQSRLRFELTHRNFDKYIDQDFGEYITKVHELELNQHKAYQAIFDAVDSSSEWIYSFMSPFGECFVRTVDEAVEVCALVEKLKGKKLLQWKQHKKETIIHALKLIKLGVNGGIISHI